MLGIKLNENVNNRTVIYLITVVMCEKYSLITELLLECAVCVIYALTATRH